MRANYSLKCVLCDLHVASHGHIGRDGAVYAHVLDSMFYSTGTMVLWHLSPAVGGISQVLLKL